MKERTIWILLAATTVAAFAMWRLARQDSLTVDELPHLAAGYSYLHHQTGRLNPEHPPLVKLLAALPVRDIALPRSLLEQPTPPQELQYEAGRQALQGDYGRSRRIIRRARLAPILLTLLLAWAVYGFGRWLHSAQTGLLAALFLLASPLVLAHGHYVTTDVGAALGCLAATWAFLALLRNPRSRRALLIAAVAFGLAQLTKFSALLLIPFFIVLAWYKPEALWTIPLGFALIVAPAYWWINQNYPHELQRRDVQAALDGRPGRFTELTQLLVKHQATRHVAQYTLGLALASNRIHVPARYYFNGRNSDQETAWYFPLAYLWKEPLPALLFAAGALLLIPARSPLLLFVALYAAVTLYSALHIGVRHLLPAYPFLFLAAAEAWRSQGRRAALAATALLAWNLGETAYAYPHLLSYCNPAAGGTAHCYQKLIDSNYDWGQDLERLRQWSLQHPGTIALDYFGGDSAADALGGRVIGWWSGRGDPRAQGARYFAISVHLLQTLTQPIDYEQPAEDRYPWLLQMRRRGKPGQPPPPDYRVGTTIFVYDLAR